MVSPLSSSLAACVLSRKEFAMRATERVAFIIAALLSLKTVWHPLRLFGRRQPEQLVIVPTPLLLSWTVSTLEKAGLAPKAADVVARALVAAQRDGRGAHGMARLPAIVRSLQNGEVAGSALPRITRIRPALLQVDAQNGLAMPAISQALPELAIAVRQHGIAALSVVDARGIVGALWVPLERMASEHGIAVVACCNSPAFVCPTGGTARVFGTNPIAFAWPRHGKPPLVADFACSTISRGDMQHLARQRKPLPTGSALDPSGRPTTDASAGLAGTQLAFGGHKGSALALLVELLSASLIGTELGVEGGDSSEAGGMRRGLFFIGLDVDAHHGAARESAERLFAAVFEAGGRLPGDGRYAHRARCSGDDGGIAVDAPLLIECFGTTELTLL